MSGDDGVDEIAAEAPKMRKGPVLVSAGNRAMADDICDRDRGELRVSLMCASLRGRHISPNASPESACFQPEGPLMCAFLPYREHQAGRSGQGPGCVKTSVELES